MVDPQAGNGRHPKLAGCLHTAMSGEDGHLLVDQHRVGETEALDAVGDLADLFLRMGAGVTCPRTQGRNRDLEDLVMCHDNVPDEEARSGSEARLRAQKNRHRQTPGRWLGSRINFKPATLRITLAV